MTDFVAAMKLKLHLIEENTQNAEDLDKIKISAFRLFKNNFSFPEVAHNDFSAEALENLEIAEKNFNADLDNSDLLKTFIATGVQVRNDLKEHFGDQWTDPADGDVPTEGDE